MIKGKYYMNEPSTITQERMLELNNSIYFSGRKLYLFVESFLNKFGKYSRAKSEFIGLVCTTYNIDTTTILTAIESLEVPPFKPTQLEIAVTNHLMGVPVRFLSEQKIVSTGNYYKLLQEYIDNGEPALQPRLTDLHLENIKIFFESIEGMFYHISHLIKGDVGKWF